MKYIIPCLLLSTSAYSANCPDQKEVINAKWMTTYECNAHLLTKEIETYISNKQVTRETIYKGDKLHTVKSWSTDGRFTYSMKRSYLDDDNYIEELYDTETNKVKERTKYNNQDDKIGDWVIKSGREIAIRHFKNSEKPFKIDMLDKQLEVLKSYMVKIDETVLAANLVKEFDVLDPQGKLLGSYNENKDPNLLLPLKKQEPLVIIDTGFDIGHEALRDKLYNSPYDIYGDGIDNDGNGRIDDSFGWQRQDDPGLGLLRNDNNIKETHSLIHTPFPVSHGTHVASLALRDIDNFGLVGFAGDVAIPDHLQKAGEYISNKKVKFVNMSFSIGFPGAMMSAPRDSFHFLEKLINTNENTLFIIAAGNTRSAHNLDLQGNGSYPASYEYKNTIKVAALNSPDFDEDRAHTYKRASFSKYGRRVVQVFAPGKQVVAAQSGAGTIALNGTSMAAPFVTNVLLKGHNIHKDIDVHDLNQLLLKTVFVPQSPLDCQSGGMVFPRRFYYAVERVKEGASVSEAIDLARKNIRAKNELRFDAVVKGIWKDRGI